MQEIEGLLSGAGLDLDTITDLSTEMGTLNEQLATDMDRWAELAERA